MLTTIRVRSAVLDEDYLLLGIASVLVSSYRWFLSCLCPRIACLSFRNTDEARKPFPVSRLNDHSRREFGVMGVAGLGVNWLCQQQERFPQLPCCVPSVLDLDNTGAVLEVAIRPCKQKRLPLAMCLVPIFLFIFSIVCLHEHVRVCFSVSVSQPVRLFWLPPLRPFI